ncbi:transcriptional regulator [Haladaptatus pallidirubidus]|uniref:DUF7344 domain-containing protein n=1 Tax=Haladaptatus pallidirubidus TaxID=1008152 RepID=A0AAV3UMX3_9EURY|nr:ArsR family transcriptional regulator [Haladaptatus pallidirubidus]
MLDDQLRVLSNVRRRRLLLALLQDNPQNDRTMVSNASASTDEKRRRAVAMGHVHLPQLDDHGYIEWNREERSVTKGSRFDEIKPLLTVLEPMQDDVSADELPE